MIDASCIAALVRELAMQSQCVGIDEARNPAGRCASSARPWRAGARDKLQAALSEALGTASCGQLEIGAASTRRRCARPPSAPRRQREAEHTIHNDPLVQSLMQQFKTARIVPGSVKPL